MFLLLHPVFPKKAETGNSRMESAENPRAEKSLRARVIMFRGTGRVKFAGAVLCPMRHGPLPGPARLICACAIGEDRRMSAFTEHQEELERYEQMFGKERGRLAVGLDRLTNALVLVGQHGVYCTSQRNPTLPAMDIRMITQELSHAKELVQSVMEEIRKRKEAAR